MTRPEPGTYRVGTRTDTGEAIVQTRCPFCESLNTYTVPRPQVSDPQRVLVFRCPHCNIQETYVPQH